jgi:hypothetical protein
MSGQGRRAGIQVTAPICQGTSLPHYKSRWGWLPNETFGLIDNLFSLVRGFFGETSLNGHRFPSQPGEFLQGIGEFPGSVKTLKETVRP